MMIIFHRCVLSSGSLKIRLISERNSRTLVVSRTQHSRTLLPDAAMCTPLIQDATE